MPRLTSRLTGTYVKSLEAPLPLSRNDFILSQNEVIQYNSLISYRCNISRIKLSDYNSGAVSLDYISKFIFSSDCKASTGFSPKIPLNYIKTILWTHSRIPRIHFVNMNTCQQPFRTLGISALLNIPNTLQLFNQTTSLKLGNKSCSKIRLLQDHFLNRGNKI